MPTIIYAVHGMGCGTADGAAPAAADAWSSSVLETIQWIFQKFGVRTPTVVLPGATAAPADAPDPRAIWFVPVSYHRVFDEFRASSTDRDTIATRLSGAERALVDGCLPRLADKPFLWVNCLDVVLWWADRAQARNQVTTAIGDAFTTVDALAQSVPGATIRRIVISHSLGTAATTAAMRQFGNQAPWAQSGAIEAWFTLANVAPFLLSANSVYTPPLIPGRGGALIAGRMYNLRQEFDPVPWLLPPLRYDPLNSAAKADWTVAANAERYVTREFPGICAIDGRTPSITDVHGFMNYLLSPDVAIRLAGHARGSFHSDAELAQIDYAAARAALPTLQCADTSAFDDLKNAVATYKAGVPPFVPAGGSVPDWAERLIRAAELLMAAKKKC